MLGSPYLAALFERGMRAGGAMLGLPFYFLALVSLAILLDLLVVRMRKGEGEEAVEDGEAQGLVDGRER